MSSLCAVPALSSAVSQLFPTNAVPTVPVTGGIAPSSPLSLTFTPAVGEDTPATLSGYTYDQIVFAVSCPSTVTLYFSGTAGNYTTASLTGGPIEILAISLVNAVAPSIELNPNLVANTFTAPVLPGLTADAGSLYITPQPVLLTLTTALLPGTYIAKVHLLLEAVDSTLAAYLGGSMTARVVKTRA